LATDPIFGGLGIALIFGSMAATLVSLFFIPVLMDNTNAIMPTKYKESDNDNNEYFQQFKEQVSGSWCVLTGNLRDYFISYRDKWNEKK